MIKHSVSCSTCGSSDVRCDAYAAWNPETQQYEVVTTFDDWVCEDCGGECSVSWNTSP